MLPHFDPDANVFIAGATRGGKTVTGNHAHAEFNGVSIFFNSEEENNIVGFSVSSPAEILQGIKSQGWQVKLDYRPSGGTKKQLLTELTMVKDILFKLADAYNRSKPIQLVVDECQDYGPQGGSENAFHVLVRKGLKRNIKIIGLSQDPATVSKTVIRQMHYKLWCGGFDPYYAPYFKKYKFPVDEIKKGQQGDAFVFVGATLVKKFRSPARYA